ncbi:PBSX family phage terminase large subunit [Lacticaseibacillus sharpeae JCM 1186 = DSM 20505]|uniref:PBSX family phage terminase large subunit n=1 Tax=Lacticaseibacillus sharpeae JCM 1186 = DSM 20505 TaxID=1291052 RepID=A0A0R1ZUG6_9LACO|nr:PBSX family phage terminase large subunit [Lacticaseibacillus sharpeae JCM 1186 = DSM 20505]
MKASEIIAPAFYPVFWDVLEHRFSKYYLVGGRGSTKSSFVSVIVVLGMMRDQDANAVVLRKVASTLRESVFDQYLWAIDALGASDLWRVSVSPLQLTYRPTGQQIRFKGVDKPKKIKSQKFRVGWCKFIHYEEFDEFNGEAELRNVSQSLGRGGDGIVEFRSCNPPASQNSWANQSVKAAEFRPDALVHRSDYLTVPKKWLGLGFIADAEQLKKDNPTAYAHEYLGEVTGTGAEVFTNLTLRELSDDEVAQFDHTRRGLDFGFAHDPLAYVMANYDPTYRRLYIYGELYKVGMSNANAISAIKALNPNNDVIFADSAEPRTVYEFHDAGLNLFGARKGPGSREHGMKWLQDLRQIIIDPIRCPNAAREFGGYELARDATGGFKSGYPDGNDHTIDSIRYSLQNDMRRGAR